MQASSDFGARRRRKYLSAPTSCQHPRLNPTHHVGFPKISLVGVMIERIKCETGHARYRPLIHNTCLQSNGSDATCPKGGSRPTMVTVLASRTMQSDERKPRLSW